MKKILAKDLSKFQECKTILFYGNSIIVDKHTNSPIILFKQVMDELPIERSNIFLDSDLLFVQVTFPPESSHNDLNIKYRISPTKYFLQETSNVNIDYIIRGMQWVNWDARYQHCSKCGIELVEIYDSFEKKCDRCELSFFPNLSPAVMVLIQRDDEILLARSPHFRRGMYSAIAGFIDIGETAEDAAHRESQEEVGLKISSLKYFGSQSWPFPSSFMVAFTAEYLSGEIIMQPDEIEDARWFNIKKLPELPAMPSISRRLIESVLVKK
ncbi:MAG: NAD(+) diphosphatase [Legionellaceae bacterium]|nr:NAD(+) diphosphatase [Legionellaceae bacterium]